MIITQYSYLLYPTQFLNHLSFNLQNNLSLILLVPTPVKAMQNCAVKSNWVVVIIRYNVYKNSPFITHKSSQSMTPTMGVTLTSFAIFIRRTMFISCFYSRFCQLRSSLISVTIFVKRLKMWHIHNCLNALNSVCLILWKTTALLNVQDSTSLTQLVQLNWVN